MRPLCRPFLFDRPYWKTVSQIHPSDDEDIFVISRRAAREKFEKRQRQKRLEEEKKKTPDAFLHALSRQYHIVMTCCTTRHAVRHDGVWKESNNKGKHRTISQRS